MFQTYVIVLMVLTQVWSRENIKVEKRPFQIMPVDVSVQAKVCQIYSSAEKSKFIQD